MPADDSTRQSYFLKFPKPTLELWEAALPTLKEDSKQCIGNLFNYHTSHTWAKFPQSQSAAVLVPLFIGRAGDLYVLLSRRSESLRQYAGDTALPGGKVEPQDLTAEDTARREAFEEIGLAQDCERVPLLCVLEPFLAGNQMIVTPVVVLILDKTMQPNLNESEVTSIFSQPLASFLASSFPFPPDRVSGDHSRPYHTTTDWKWNEGGTVRMHRFLTGRETDGVKPVFGLTASILIHIAILGYGRAPDFEYQPPNAPTSAQQIASALLTPTNPLRLACEREGIDANEVAASVLYPPKELHSEPHMKEWENISQDRRGLMENGERWPTGIIPSLSGTAEQMQQRVDVEDLKECKNTLKNQVQGRCLQAGSDSTSSCDLNRRKEQVGKGGQSGEQDKRRLSENVDQIRGVRVVDQRNSKL